MNIFIEHVFLDDLLIALIFRHDKKIRAVDKCNSVDMTCMVMVMIMNF